MIQVFLQIIAKIKKTMVKIMLEEKAELSQALCAKNGQVSFHISMDLGKLGITTFAEIQMVGPVFGVIQQIQIKDGNFVMFQFVVSCKNISCYFLYAYG